MGGGLIMSYFQWPESQINLPPFGVQTGFAEYNAFKLRISQLRSDTYSEISFLWRNGSDGISPERHTVIAKYYMSILLLVLVSR